MISVTPLPLEVFAVPEAQQSSKIRASLGDSSIKPRIAPHLTMGHLEFFFFRRLEWIKISIRNVAFLKLGTKHLQK
jgi:hypothetical protein